MESFAKGFRESVTLSDYESLLGCMPPNRNLKTYRLNVKNLFWPEPDQRALNFLSKFTAVAYEDAFNIILTNPPDEGWDLKLIMNQIHDKGIVCKSVMLHVGFWFSPELEEPANRANVKPPMYEHLKVAFSKYHSSHPMYESDESWKPQALALQRVVLKFALLWWPRSNAIIGNLGMLRDMSAERYSQYISSSFWNSLLREVRKNTSAPFQHASLVSFKDVNDIPPNHGGILLAQDDVGMKVFRGQVRNIIREEYSDHQNLDSEDGVDSLEDRDDSTFTSQYTGKDGRRYTQTDSAPPEPLTVESDDDGDIIHVQTPSPSASNPSKRRKVQHTQEDLGYMPVYDDQYALPQKPLQMIVKLKMPASYFAPPQIIQNVAERPHNSARKRPYTHTSPAHQPIHEPSPTISAPSRATPALMTPAAGTEPEGRALPRSSLEQQTNSEHVISAEINTRAPEPVIQPASWHESERDTARRALDEYESNTKSTTLQEEDSEERISMSNQQPQRPHKHNLPQVDRISTPKAPTPSPAPPSLSHLAYLAQTPLAASPALSTNKTEQAILVLQDEFGERLKIGEMIAAIKFLKNDLEAGIFLTLKPGPLRNAWLWDGIKDDIKAN